MQMIELRRGRCSRTMTAVKNNINFPWCCLSICTLSFLYLIFLKFVIYLLNLYKISISFVFMASRVMRHFKCKHPLKWMCVTSRVYFDSGLLLLCVLCWAEDQIALTHQPHDFVNVSIFWKHLFISYIVMMDLTFRHIGHRTVIINFSKNQWRKPDTALSWQMHVSLIATVMTAFHSGVSATWCPW